MSSFDKAAPVFTSRVHSIGPLQSWHWAKTVTYWENTGIQYILYMCSVYSVVHCHENVLRMWIVFCKRLDKLHMAGKVTKDTVDKVTYILGPNNYLSLYTEDRKWNKTELPSEVAEEGAANGKVGGKNRPLLHQPDHVWPTPAHGWGEVASVEDARLNN